jgi:hypothetical protein
MPTKREQDGWLPDPVQQIANAAARCGLVPLIEIGYDGSISLRNHRDEEVGVVAMIGGAVTLFANVDGGCDTIEDGPAILAWITRTTGRYAA